MKKVFKAFSVLMLALSIFVVVVGINMLAGKVSVTQTVGGVSTLSLGVLCTVIVIIIIYTEGGKRLC